MSYARSLAWWNGLSAEERAEALNLNSEIPDHLAAKMRAAELVPVSADLADGDGHRTVWLMPTVLRDFLDEQRTRQLS